MVLFHLALDLNELTASTVSVANDSIAIIDADDNSPKERKHCRLSCPNCWNRFNSGKWTIKFNRYWIYIAGVTAGAGLTGGGAPWQRYC